MTPEELMINALKGIVPYPMLRRAVKVSVDAIRAAQAEQRRKDAEMAKGMRGALEAAITFIELRFKFPEKHDLVKRLKKALAIVQEDVCGPNSKDPGHWQCGCRATTAQEKP